MLNTSLIIIAALALDWYFGEPRSWHPLVGFGNIANRVKRLCYGKSHVSNQQRIVRGFIAVCLLLLPVTIASYWISQFNIIADLFAVIVLTYTIGHKSLHDHTHPIAHALLNNDLQQARYYTSRIVSRDPASLNIAKASIESILENGADSVFSALFWFIVAGVPGVIFYRLANTLDAMWGYKNDQYLYFGRIAARLDDGLNYIPARLTALTYALVGNTKSALHSWRTQASQWDSPNAGPVMASGAGALQLSLGGPAEYDGVWHQRIILGCGPSPQASDIHRALKLLRHSVCLWIVVLIAVSGFTYA